MGLFSKPITLALLLFQLEDENHPSPGQSHDAQNLLAKEIIKAVVSKHYRETFKPSVKWNYFFLFGSAPGDVYRTEFAHLDFRDAKTNEICKQKQFLDFCDELMMQLVEGLAEENPKYDKAKLLVATADSKYDWFPEHGLAVISALLPGFIK